MKKFTFLLLAFSGVFSTTMNAQRVVDFAVQSIVKPDTIKHQSPWDFHFVAVNNGPDPALAGDTIFFRLWIGNLAYPTANPNEFSVLKLNKTMNAGDTVNVILTFNPLNVTGDFTDTSRVLLFLVNGNPNDSVTNEGESTISNNYMQRTTYFDGVNAGIKQGLEEGAFTSIIYPNPVSDEASITFFANANEDFSVKVFDINGKEILSSSGLTVSDKNMISINVQALNAGIYFYELNVGGAVSKNKFIVR